MLCSTHTVVVLILSPSGYQDLVGFHAFDHVRYIPVHTAKYWFTMVLVYQYILVTTGIYCCSWCRLSLNLLGYLEPQQFIFFSCSQGSQARNPRTKSLGHSDRERLPPLRVLRLSVGGTQAVHRPAPVPTLSGALCL